MPNAPVGASFMGPVTSPKAPAFHQTVNPLWRIAGATPYLSASELKGGSVGAAYSETITAAGGVSPYVFSVLSGALPTGTTINSSTGVISGTPSATGTFTFTIKAVDAMGNIATQSFSIVIAASGSGSGAFGWVG